MSHVWVTSSTTKILTPSAIALGNFDGLHRGHQKVLQSILNCNRALEKIEKYIYSTLVTFNPHPREFFSGEKRKLLTPLPEKIKQLELLGVEQLVLLPFDRTLASLTPEEFVEKIIVKHLQAKKISVGEDFCFGNQRQGTAVDLKAIAAKFGIFVNITQKETCPTQEKISSSRIRQALEEGKIHLVKEMLGRSYTLTGTVVTGQQLGRKIGFPTANLEIPSDKFLPRYGVYAVEVFLDSLRGEKTKSISPLQGVMNIGCRPTVDGTNPTIEIHLFDWEKNIYGETLTVKIEEFIRTEKKFSGIEELKKQIAADCKTARQYLNKIKLEYL